MCERSGRSALRYAASLLVLRTSSRLHARNAMRRREKGFNALELSLSQPELIRHPQVLPAAFESRCQIRWKLSLQRSAVRTNRTRNEIAFNLGELASTACAADDFGQGGASR